MRISLLCLSLTMVACADVTMPSGAHIRTFTGKVAYQKGADGSESLVMDHDTALGQVMPVIGSAIDTSILGSVTKAVTSSNNALEGVKAKEATKQTIAKIPPTVTNPVIVPEGSTAVFPQVH